MGICTIDGCDRAWESQRMCHSHYEYFRRHGKKPTGPILDTVQKRFWAKVKKTRTCWLWTAATDGDGRYGSFFADGRLVRAHQWAWEQVNGPVPFGCELDHRCRRTLCVRPDHLDPVTHRENIHRGISFAAVNARKTHCPKGHEYSPENTYNLPSGGRACRTCARETGAERQRRHRERKRNAAH